MNYLQTKQKTSIKVKVLNFCCSVISLSTLNKYSCGYIPWVVGGGRGRIAIHVLWAIIPVHAHIGWSGRYVCMLLSLL